MKTLGKDCAMTMNPRTGLGLSEDQRIKRALELCNPFVDGLNIEVIGSGHESIVITDRVKVYKIFDRDIPYYEDLMSQLIGRFRECERFVNDLDAVVEDGHTILFYPYQESAEYRGGREEEMKEFLVECALSGVVTKDVKPENFRIFNNGIRYIDLGWDVIPYNHKDFIFMCQRAYLTLNGWANPDFKSLARMAINKWNIPELKGFNRFFNEVYEVVLKNKKNRKSPPLLRVPEDVWLSDVVNDSRKGSADESNIIVVPHLESDVHHWSRVLNQRVESLNSLSSISERFDNVFYISESTVPNDLGNVCNSIIDYMEEDGTVHFLLPNPFFSEQPDSLGLDGHMKLFAKHSLMIKNVSHSPPRPDGNGDFFSRLIHFECQTHQNHGHDVSLVIKTCYQDGHVIERLVRHLVSQLEYPDTFLEKIVVVDGKENGFLRQYAETHKESALNALTLLRSEGIIDEFFISPNDPKFNLEVNRRWFGLNILHSHCVRGIPVTPQLFAFEKAKGRYILQTDCDAIVVRRDRAHSFLKDMKKDLNENENSLSVSFNITHDPKSARMSYTSPGDGMYVPEVRICLLDNSRLMEGRPYPNEAQDERLKLTWYRSLELAQKKRSQISLRGGDPRSFYIHPPNEFKGNPDFWFRVLDRAESSIVPAQQFENVDLTGTIDDWSLPKRDEPFVFIICGRNLSNRKFLRCWQSIINQSRGDWGAIIVNDCSDGYGLHECIRSVTAEHSARLTYLHNPFVRSILINIHHAIRSVCTNPHSVIVIVDMDDMLLSNHVLDVLSSEYLKGVDMTVGNCLKTSKGILPFIPDFKNTRNERLGDVWMHLRTFRKHLFDAICDEDFKKDGEWIDKFNELTYMVPISEMATSPKYLTWPIYLWEPGHVRNEEHYRMNDEIKRFIQKKEKYPPRPTSETGATPILPPGELLRWIQQGNVTFIRHAEKRAKNRPWENSRLTDGGIRDAMAWGLSSSIEFDLFITSSIERCAETAWCVRKAQETDNEIVNLESLKGIFVRNRAEWRKIKQELGFGGAIERWVEGGISTSTVYPHSIFVNDVIKEILTISQGKQASNVLVVTHDHMLLAISRAFNSPNQHKVRYLHGFTVTKEMLQKKLDCSGGSA